MDTILIVDDEPDLREALRTLLELEKFRVVECSNGHEARLRVFEDPPDLIVSDIAMPEMNGWDLIHELRTLPLTKHTPFLFLTGHIQKSTYDDALMAGVDGVLAKPIKPSELIKTARSLIEKHRSLRAESLKSAEGLRTALSLALPHGLNTSLHLIDGYTTLLASHVGKEDEHLQSMATRIQEATKRLHTTLEKLWLLLEVEGLLGRSQGEGRDAMTTPSELGIVLRTVAVDVATTHGRTVTVPPDIPPATVLLAERYASHLFHELVENAVLFSPKSAAVVVSVETGQGTVEITVRDKGRGLVSEPVENLPAFEEFQRNRFALKGHGLGLAIVARILRLAGGQIRLTTVPGEGTTVRVQLPRQ